MLAANDNGDVRKSREFLAFVRRFMREGKSREHAEHMAHDAVALLVSARRRPNDEPKGAA